MRVPFAEVTPQQHSREADFITSNIQHRSSYPTQLIPPYTHFFSSSAEGDAGDFSTIQKPDSYVENQWIFHTSGSPLGFSDLPLLPPTGAPEFWT